ncbi:MAG: GIY-YIG nuclease family protein [Pseudomonadota bacterium]
MARFDFIAAYILANKKNGTIYTGSTTDLLARLDQHKSGTGSVFTGKYGCTRLVWFEQFDLMKDAINRERRIKSWPRKWKINLIETINPEWRELPLY